MLPAIDLYTDGSCPKNPGPGGWAFAFKDRDRIFEGAGAVDATTNNRMEMMGVIRGLEYLRRYYFSHVVDGGSFPQITVYSDSQYVIKGLQDWSHKWRKHGWQRRDYKTNKWLPVSNADLWQQLYPMVHDELKVQLKWVRGHIGIELNERCDVLAGEAVKKLIMSL